MTVKADYIIKGFLLGIMLSFFAIPALGSETNIIGVTERGVGPEFHNAKGIIDMIDKPSGEIIISDLSYLLTGDTEYLTGRGAPLSSDKFDVGTWVVYRVNDAREVEYLKIAVPPAHEGNEPAQIPEGAASETKNNVNGESQATGGEVYQDSDGVYRN